MWFSNEKAEVYYCTFAVTVIALQQLPLIVSTSVSYAQLAQESQTRAAQLQLPLVEFDLQTHQPLQAYRPFVRALKLFLLRWIHLDSIPRHPLVEHLRVHAALSPGQESDLYVVVVAADFVAVVEVVAAALAMLMADVLINTVYVPETF
jgi:hypothetical protein